MTRTIEVPTEKIVEKVVEVPVKVIKEVEKLVQDPELLAAYKNEVSKNEELESKLNEALDELEKFLNPTPVNITPVYELPANILDQLSPKADNFDPFAQRGSATFGTAWPTNPAKGDLFLKIDSKPNKLYKWNGRKWIEIDRHRVNDTLIYDPTYIDFVIDQVRRGHRDYEDLSDSEKAQIMERIKQRGNDAS